MHKRFGFVKSLTSIIYNKNLKLECKRNKINYFDFTRILFFLQNNYNLEKIKYITIETPHKKIILVNKEDKSFLCGKEDNIIININKFNNEKIVKPDDVF